MRNLRKMNPQKQRVEFRFPGTGDRAGGGYMRKMLVQRYKLLIRRRISPENLIYSKVTVVNNITF